VQATKEGLTSRSTSSSSNWVENASTSSSDRVPYGARSLSPRYSVGSRGVRRMISRKTVSPPTPESKTPIGRGSDTGPLAAPGTDRDSRGADQLRRDTHQVLRDRRRGVGQDERHTLVVRPDDELAVGHDLVLRDAPQGALEILRLDAARAIRPVHQVADLR